MLLMLAADAACPDIPITMAVTVWLEGQTQTSLWQGNLGLVLSHSPDHFAKKRQMTGRAPMGSFLMISPCQDDAS